MLTGSHKTSQDSSQVGVQIGRQGWFEREGMLTGSHKTSQNSSQVGVQFSR